MRKTVHPRMTCWLPLAAPLFLLGCDTDDGSAMTDASTDAVLDGGSSLDATFATDGSVLTDADVTDSAATSDAGALVDLSGAQKSGSRLKARFYVNADGVRDMQGWYDSARNQSCTPLRAADGMIRCLPLATNAGSAYSDANCQLATTALPNGVCDVPELAYVLDNKVCPPRRAIYERGAQLFSSDGGVPDYYYRPGDTCSGPYPGNASTKVYARGAEVPPSSFVGFSEDVLELGNGLRVVRYVGEDGSRALGRIEDTERGFTCLMQLATDSTYRCLPQVNVSISDSQFLDAQCTRRAVSDYEPACTASYGLQQSNLTCAPSFKVYEVTRQGSVGYNLLGGTQCTMAPGSSQSVYDAVGNELPATTFKAPKVVDGAAFGRLRPRLQELAPGVRRVHQWVDTDVNDICVFERAADGELRCLPIGTSPAIVSNYYGNDTCTQRLATFANACAPRAALSADTSVCPNRRHVFAITGRYMGTTLYTKSGSTCSAAANPVASGQSLWIMGDEIDPSVMVRVEEQRQ